MSNLFLIIGENDLLRQQHVTNLKKASVQKYGEFNVQSVDVLRDDLSALEAEILTPPFFGEGKRIFFLQGFPLSTVAKANTKQKEQLERLTITLTEKLDADTVVIATTNKPDKRTKTWKSLSKIADVKDFAAWERDKFGHLPDDALQYVRHHIPGIDQQTATFLLNFVGLESMQIARECDKLRLWQQGSGQKVTSEVIEQVCLPCEEVANFAFSNAV